MTIPLMANGLPRVTETLYAEFRRVSSGSPRAYLPGGKYIDGAKARDVGNNPYQTALRAGLMLGEVTASGDYANSIIGVTAGVLTGAGTSVSVSALQAAELVRRVGATGTMMITGPAIAGGTVRSILATYSGVNTGTGAITITPIGTARVEQINFNIASTGGNLRLYVAKSDGTMATTANIAWSATDATYLAAINSALDAVTTSAGDIVATAIPAVDTDLGFILTYSRTAYPTGPVTAAQVATYPTSSTAAYYTVNTAAVDGRFIAGSFIGQNDGSHIPKVFLPDGYPVMLTDDTGTLARVQFPNFQVGDIVDTAQLIDYPTSPSLRTWVKTNLSSVVGGKFVFNDEF